MMMMMMMMIGGRARVTRDEERVLRYFLIYHSSHSRASPTSVTSSLIAHAAIGYLSSCTCMNNVSSLSSNHAISPFLYGAHTEEQ